VRSIGPCAAPGAVPVCSCAVPLALAGGLACCRAVAGNYYSLKGSHEKAVAYFRRSLVLDRRSGGAWTLVGHEYVELKNTAAAVEAYRHAVGACSLV
jgi:hypothetical protein